MDLIHTTTITITTLERSFAPSPVSKHTPVRPIAFKNLQCISGFSRYPRMRSGEKPIITLWLKFVEPYLPVV